MLRSDRRPKAEKTRQQTTLNSPRSERRWMSEGGRLGVSCVVRVPAHGHYQSLLSSGIIMIIVVIIIVI